MTDDNFIPMPDDTESTDQPEATSPKPDTGLDELTQTAQDSARDAAISEQQLKDLEDLLDAPEPEQKAESETTDASASDDSDTPPAI